MIPVVDQGISTFVGMADCLVQPGLGRTLGQQFVEPVSQLIEQGAGPGHACPALDLGGFAPNFVLNGVYRARAPSRSSASFAFGL